MIRSHQLVLLTTSAGLFGFRKMAVPTWVVNRVSLRRGFSFPVVPARIFICFIGKENIKKRNKDNLHSDTTFIKKENGMQITQTICKK